MIKLFGPTVPNRVYIALSGGVDSMCALSFLSQKPYREVKAAFFHHGTEDSENALQYLTGFCEGYGVDLTVGHISSIKPRRKSPEEHWRDERYKFLHSLDGPVVTGHHLDDCVETWLFTAMHGKPRTIPYANGNVIRPFLLTRKAELESWCHRKGMETCPDESNNDTRFTRNYIRHNMIPIALQINPGLHKVVAREVREAGW